MANIIVAGGCGVLGRAIVGEAMAHGHRVAIVDMAPKPADLPDAVAFGGVDLADADAVAAAYSEAATTLGVIDGLVNVAGGFVWETVEAGAIDSWDAMYRINLRTAAISSRAVLAHFGATGGAIVNVGAAAASNVAAGMAPYAASKAGVMALTESLADELKPRGIRVNAVLPTIIDTPANRRDMPDADTASWVTPQAAAKVTAFLLSTDAGCITGVGIRLSARGLMQGVEPVRER